jgi:hypothetical protein
MGTMNAARKTCEVLSETWEINVTAIKLRAVFSPLPRKRHHRLFLQLTSPRFPSLHTVQPRPCPRRSRPARRTCPCRANPIFSTAQVSSIAHPAAPDGVHPITATSPMLPPSQSTRLPSRLTSSTLHRDPAWMPACHDSKAAFPIPLQSSHLHGSTAER